MLIWMAVDGIRSFDLKCDGRIGRNGRDDVRKVMCKRSVVDDDVETIIPVIVSGQLLGGWYSTPSDSCVWSDDYCTNY